MNAFSLIKSAANILFMHRRAVFFPFMVLMFFYLLALQLLYFIPFEPLTGFFGPIVEKLYGQIYLHYPFNLSLLPKLFQHLQIAIFLVFGSLLIPMSIQMVIQYNNDEEVSVKKAFVTGLANYVFIFIVLAMLVACLMWKMELFGMIVKRAHEIQSTAGKFYVLKKTILHGASYMNLLIDVFIQSLFALIVPICVVYKKKILGGLILNLKFLKSSWRTVFAVILLPSLFYVPILVVREISTFKETFPEISLVLLFASVVASIVIDAIIYTSLTILCLVKKEST